MSGEERRHACEVRSGTGFVQPNAEVHVEILGS